MYIVIWLETMNTYLLVKLEKFENQTYTELHSYNCSGIIKK